MKIVGSFGSFTTARLGIYASQQGLNLTGHNITNINTEGFTRQKLDQMALRTGAPDRFGYTHTALPGNGVLLTGISQIRDPYLDIRFRNEQSSVGAMDAKLSGLEDIAQILDEIYRSEGEGVVEAAFNKLHTQLNNYTNYVSQQEFDTNIRSASESLVALLNSYSEQLSNVYDNQKESFHDDVDRVNYLLKSIGDINATIRRSDIHGDPGLELRDQRNLYIDELSQYIKINVRYEQVGVGLGETVENMVLSLAGTNGGTDASKSVLLDGRFYTQFSERDLYDPDDMPQYISVETPPGSGNYVNQIDPLNPGTLIEDSFALGLSALKDSKGMAHDIYNTAKELGDNDLYGGLQASREILTEAGEFTDKVVLDKIDPSANTKRGIPYYQKALDALAIQFATVMNNANTGYMYNDKGEYVNSLGEAVAAYSDGINPAVTLTKDMQLTDAMKTYLNANGVPIGGALFSNSSANNDTSNITAANISVSKAWSIREVLVVNSFQMGNGKWDANNPARPGSTDTSNLEHMLVEFRGGQSYTAQAVNDDAYDKTKVYFKGSFQEFLANMNTTLATDMNSTTNLLKNYVAASNELQTSRDSVSGVDLNDETVNLMQYQKTYSAACRVMTTLDEALDKLINNMGIVGR